MDFELARPKEIAIIGPSTGLQFSTRTPSNENLQPIAQDDSQTLLGVVFEEYHPNQVVALKHADAESVIPLLQERVSIDGKATAYVCQNFACQIPVSDADALRAKLNGWGLREDLTFSKD